MELNVINRELAVGEIRTTGYPHSSLLLIGDANTIQLASTFDTPAESLIIGALAPLARKPRLTMWKRNSFVQFVDVKSLILSGVVEIGDTVQLKANHNVIAVQREQEIFFGNEGNFEDYPIFSEPIPIPSLPAPGPMIRIYHEAPNIRVGQIHIKGISTSGMMQIGSTNTVCLESRVLHIRQLSAE